MTCPTCGGELTVGGERCPVCGAMVAPRVEGALAPAPRPVTPPGRAKVEPLRDIPGLRKRERTWRDEVQERVRSRRQRRVTSHFTAVAQLNGMPLTTKVWCGRGCSAPSWKPTWQCTPTPRRPGATAVGCSPGSKGTSSPRGV